MKKLNTKTKKWMQIVLALLLFVGFVSNAFKGGDKVTGALIGAALCLVWAVVVYCKHIKGPRTKKDIRKPGKSTAESAPILSGRSTASVNLNTSVNQTVSVKPVASVSPTVSAAPIVSGHSTTSSKPVASVSPTASVAPIMPVKPMAENAPALDAAVPPRYEFVSFNVAGTTFDTDGVSRQALLRKIKFGDAPFENSDSLEVSLRPSTYEGSPCIECRVNDVLIGYVPKAKIDDVMQAIGQKGATISAFDVQGGGRVNGERINFGALVVVRYEV